MTDPRVDACPPDPDDLARKAEIQRRLLLARFEQSERQLSVAQAEVAKAEGRLDRAYADRNELYRKLRDLNEPGFP